MTEAIRRKPYSVLLFDEIEKAHPDVFNVLLQLLDDGRLTDSQGRTVDFKNTVVIMTSNIGAGILLRTLEKNMPITESIKGQVLSETHKFFKPEFINRIDDTIVFTPLGESELYEIVDKHMLLVNKRMESLGLEVRLTSEAKQYVINHSFEPAFGARPIKRFLQKHVENLLAHYLLTNTDEQGQILLIDTDGDKLYVK